MTHTSPHSMTNPEMQQCIDACVKCSAVCTQTLQHCLDHGGKHAERAHVTTLLDCADICQASANFLLRGSALHVKTCAACAAVCRACEEECRRMGDDEVMRACADQCRRCAESCERMAAADASR